MKYPIGIQHFESLRKDGYAYVDKTQHIYNFANTGRYYFLSRPRRFGKSLLLSTIRAYFEGKKELFDGLALGSLEEKWEQYPILYLDLNVGKYDTPESLTAVLSRNLEVWEQMYGDQFRDRSVEERFWHIIRQAHDKTGRSVVILVDEYDKPMLQAIGNEALQAEFRSTLKAFYGNLKSCDEYIKFAFLTGVTKFGKVSVFSDLNHLTDLTLDSRFADICGISEIELRDYFDEGIQELSDANGMSKEDCYSRLKRDFDGYHFCVGGHGMYNPFSVEYHRSSSVW